VVNVRLFSGVHYHYGVLSPDFDAQRQKQRCAHLSSPQQYNLAFQLRLLLENCKSPHLDSHFQLSVRAILDQLVALWKASHNSTEDFDFEKEAQFWLIDNLSKWCNTHSIAPLQPYLHLYLFDLTTLLPVACFVGPHDVDPGVSENLYLIWPSFSPDSQLLASGSGDGALYLYDLTPFGQNRLNNKMSLSSHLQTIHTLPNSNIIPRARPDMVLRGHTSLVNACAFHPTKKLIVTVSDDTHLCIWHQIANT
jgi:hypothetical protein